MTVYTKLFTPSENAAIQANERAGFFAHELRNVLGTASLAFVAAKAGNLSLSGATGSILQRSLFSLSKMIDESLVDVRAIGQHTEVLSSFSVAQFIAELASAAHLAAKAKGCVLLVGAVDAALAVSGNRELLLSAAANLLQNAIKFTKVGSDVKLNAYASAERIQIDVSDHCGGLPPRAETTMFLPFAQNGSDRTGLGLGLTIAQNSVVTSGGTLSVRDVPSVGCVFTISLPRLAMPT